LVSSSRVIPPHERRLLVAIYSEYAQDHDRSMERHTRPWRTTSANLEDVEHLEGVKDFLVLARCWVVERTFTWPNFSAGWARSKAIAHSAIYAAIYAAQRRDWQRQRRI